MVQKDTGRLRVRTRASPSNDWKTNSLSTQSLNGAFLYPRSEKVCLCGGGVGVIPVYICPWFRPSFLPSFRNSVTLFRQRYLHKRLR